MTTATGDASVLGIDAAWTETQSSGVALIERRGARWRCVAVASAYGPFLGAGEAPGGAWPGARALLAEASRRAGGREVTVIAVDMPLARGPITKRRCADDAVSRAFGAAKCSTHTPSATRPGKLADRIRQQFEEAGYALATAEVPAGTERRLLEVYPHPALLGLCKRTERLPYKAAKRRRYWKEETPEKRLELLLAEWTVILAALRARIDGIELSVPGDTSGRSLKAFEDALDALVCAWVGAEYLDGRARPFGDHDAAIWIPTEPRSGASAETVSRMGAE